MQVRCTSPTILDIFFDFTKWAKSGFSSFTGFDKLPPVELMRSYQAIYVHVARS